MHVDDLHSGKLLQDTARRQSGCQRTQPPRESDVPAIGQERDEGGLPGNGATAKFSINMHRSLELFLVCTNYADDNNAIYRQAYVYRLGAPTGDPNEIPLIEELQPRGLSAEVCNSSSCPGLVRSASQSRPIEE